jgi:hypothetical protein
MIFSKAIILKRANNSPQVTLAGHQFSTLNSQLKKKI